MEVALKTVNKVNLMGIASCCQNPNTIQELALEVNVDRINDYPLNLRSSPMPIPQEFLDNLPQSKVTLVANKTYQRMDEDKVTAITTPKSSYDIADDFTIPQDLCIEHEKGVRLVSV
jgi:hypothetical protein